MCATVPYMCGTSCSLTIQSKTVESAPDLLLRLESLSPRRRFSVGRPFQRCRMIQGADAPRVARSICTALRCAAPGPQPGRALWTDRRQRPQARREVARAQGLDTRILRAVEGRHGVRAAVVHRIRRAPEP